MSEDRMTANGGEGMTTKNAAPSLQAEEAVAATDQEIAELRRWSPCVVRGVECPVSDFHAPCDEAPDIVQRLLARIEFDASTIATLQERSREWSLALQSLTPGGSEYADDPAACVAFVREARRSEREAGLRALARERATIATLRKALEDVREIAIEPTAWVTDFDEIVRIASAALDEKEG